MGLDSDLTIAAEVTREPKWQRRAASVCVRTCFWTADKVTKGLERRSLAHGISFSSGQFRTTHLVAADGTGPLPTVQFPHQVRARSLVAGDPALQRQPTVTHRPGYRRTQRSPSSCPRSSCSAIAKSGSGSNTPAWTCAITPPAP